MGAVDGCSCASVAHGLRSPPAQRQSHSFDLISDALPFGRLWYEDASAAVDYAKHSSRSHDAPVSI